MKRSTKYIEINFCLLQGKVSRNILRVFPNKIFWIITKSFLTNKGHINGEKIILKCDIETISGTSVLAEMFKSQYINIVEKTSEKKPSHFAWDNNVSGTTQAIDLIVQSYLDHSSISHIKTTSKNQIVSITSSSNACGTNPEEIFELLSALDIKATVRFDMIPPILVKIAPIVLYQPLSNAINNSSSKGIFSIRC